MDKTSVLIAPDSFKGSASSREVGDYLERGVRRVLPDAEVTKFVIADGGEGTLDAIVSARGGEVLELEVTGPIGQRVTARYGMFDGHIAVVEMAEASGITLIEQNAANALRASTFGVGEVILDAISRGADRVLIGLGGSATSDGGVGMAKALGVRFLDVAGQDIPCGLEGLGKLASIDCSDMEPGVEGVEFVALTDVTNPLTGPEGAVRVYGPQKGLERAGMGELDTWMQRYAALAAQAVGRDLSGDAGTGAAGGLGFALAAFCGARIERGIEFVLDTIRLDEAMEGVDLVITGEGRMDAQSAFGKAPVGVARRAARRGIPVVAVVGSRADDLGEVYENGIDLVVPCATGAMSLEECMRGVERLVPIAGESAARAYLLGSRRPRQG